MLAMLVGPALSGNASARLTHQVTGELGRLLLGSPIQSGTQEKHGADIQETPYTSSLSYQTLLPCGAFSISIRLIIIAEGIVGFRLGMFLLPLAVLNRD